MTVSVHNPDQYMASLRQIIAQGRKRIGLLVGAGAPAGIFPPGSDKPLIPAVAGLTDMVMDALKADYGKTLACSGTRAICVASLCAKKRARFIMQALSTR